MDTWLGGHLLGGHLGQWTLETAGIFAVNILDGGQLRRWTQLIVHTITVTAWSGVDTKSLSDEGLYRLNPHL